MCQLILTIAAALVTSYVAVCPPELGGIAMPGQLRLLNIGNQLSMAHFAERVHAYGAKLVSSRIRK